MLQEYPKTFPAMPLADMPPPLTCRLFWSSRQAKFLQLHVPADSALNQYTRDILLAVLDRSRSENRVACRNSQINSLHWPIISLVHPASSGGLGYSSSLKIFLAHASFYRSPAILSLPPITSHATIRVGSPLIWYVFRQHPRTSSAQNSPTSPLPSQFKHNFPPSCLNSKERIVARMSGRPSVFTSQVCIQH